MKNITSHHHLEIQGKKILCAVEYEKEIKKFDITVWCENRIIGHEKVSSLNKSVLNNTALNALKTAGNKPSKQTRLSQTA